MKIKILLTITAAFVICGAVFGQSLEQQFQEADAELNRVYKKLRSQLNEEQKAELKKSQLAWIKEKDRLAKQDQYNQMLINNLEKLADKKMEKAYVDDRLTSRQSHDKFISNFEI